MAISDTASINVINTKYVNHNLISYFNVMLIDTLIIFSFVITDVIFSFAK